ncbi:histidine kinase [Pseudoflavitalea sp. G-6-1-2]|uniref:sensor histidine kinase n=1 Tax=Pseudoflavitalea sp. G-6-1-2 TaxID=2728841 RepID=UPI00146C463A|nr:histidine kinase [Pseudoflavitalea sp. G-6-1-2]NML19368.1 histidine kinase [Pseudoflavitalea sp. G-6-1-2]
MAASPLTPKENKLVFIGFWLLWSILHMYIMQGWGFSWGISITDALITSVNMAAVCTLVSINLRWYRPRKGIIPYLFLMCCALSGLAMASVHYSLKNIFSSNADYLNFLAASKGVRFSVGLLLIECAALVSELWYTMEEQKEQEKRKADAEKLAREAELYQLRQQLQPHFLFNSLNSISALVSMHPAEARKMIQQLSDFLRGTLRKDEQQWISLTDELQHLQLYLEIEKVRFGHRLQAHIEQEETTAKMQIPHMLLQPIVENAIKFGLYDTTEQVEILVSVKLVNGLLEITVQNPYDPATSSPQAGTGFGLHSAKRRLYLLFGRQDLLITHADKTNFTTTIKIPQV